MPESIQKKDQNNTVRNVAYTYDASGTKLECRLPQNRSLQYCSNLVYENGSLKYILNEEGKLDVSTSGTTGNYKFFIKDHLGNTRLVVGEGENNQPTELSHYYPFGMRMGGGLNDGNQRYKYNGKELQDETDWLDYGARMYDPAIGRWHVMDAVAESYFSYLPYNFVRNNPILRVDPNGKWDVTVHLYNNREQYGYGVAIVTNKGGDEIYRFRVRVRVRGQGTGGSDRTKKNADTPTGTYNIPSYMWIDGSIPRKGDSKEKTINRRKSYGKNFRLVMVESEKIKDTGRDEIRIHGGRQEIYDAEFDEWIEVPTDELTKTYGCLRASDADMIGLKNAIDGLGVKDKTDKPGKVFVYDDLEKRTTPTSGNNKVEVSVTYNVPEGEIDYWKNFVNNLLGN